MIVATWEYLVSVMIITLTWVFAFEIIST